MKRIPSFNNEVYLKDNIIYKRNTHEAKMYPLLKKHKIPTVRVKSINGSKIQLYYYKSKTIKEKPSKKSYKKVGRIYRKLHSIKGRNTIFTKSITKQFSNLPKYMQKRLKHYLKYAKGNSLLHCDPASTNILVGKYIKLIDFEFMRFGDPLYDIATFECKHPKKYHRYFHNGYNKERLLFYKIIFENSSIQNVRKLNKPEWAKDREINRDKYFKDLINQS